MSEFVELWVCLSATPLLGLTATLVVYTPGAGRLHPSWAGAVGQPGPLDGDGSCQRLAGYIGAARAMHVNDDAGALAGLALSLQGVLASLLIPLAFRLFQA